MSALALADLQAAFREVCLGRDRPALAAVIDDERIAADARLRIYRHHVFDSLSTALAATFSTVRALVGEGFFRAMAREYIAMTPPSGPVLAEYGADFADFIGGHERARDLIYLADSARLDWALTRAYASEGGATLDAAHLAAIAPETLGDLRLRLREGVSLLRSAYPVDRIWTVSHGKQGGTVDLAGGGVALIVFQRDDDAAFARLSPGEVALLEACDGTTSVGDALERAAAADSVFDFASALPRLLGLTVLAAPEPVP